LRERIAPNRLNLLRLKRRIEQAAQGVALLKDKREALMRAFSSHVSERIKYHDLMQQKSRETAAPLVCAYSYEGKSGLESYGWAAGRELSLDVKFEKIWGVNIATFEPAPIKRGYRQRGFNPFGSSPGIVCAAEKFEDLISLILDTAASEIRIKKLGAEIQKTSRRISSLEGSLIPEWQKTGRKISDALEEAERDEHQRVRVMLRKREKLARRFVN